MGQRVEKNREDEWHNMESVHRNRRKRTLNQLSDDMNSETSDNAEELVECPVSRYNLRSRQNKRRKLNS